MKKRTREGVIEKWLFNLAVSLQMIVRASLQLGAADMGFAAPLINMKECVYEY